MYMYPGMITYLFTGSKPSRVAYTAAVTGTVPLATRQEDTSPYKGIKTRHLTSTQLLEEVAIWNLDLSWNGGEGGVGEIAKWRGEEEALASDQRNPLCCQNWDDYKVHIIVNTHIHNKQKHTHTLPPSCSTLYQCAHAYINTYGTYSMRSWSL